jgi:expansin (peptidoglycan-binding protein)
LKKQQAKLIIETSICTHSFGPEHSKDVDVKTKVRSFLIIGLVLATGILAVQCGAYWDGSRSAYATYTGSGFSGGAALLDPIDSAMEITALNPYDYNRYGIKAAMAGAYLEVEGEYGKTTVYVTDLYPEGGPGALDLCPTSFAKLGNVLAGKINIKWHLVKGPVTGNFSYRIKEGSNPYWMAIQVRNHKFPVYKMEYYQNGQWVNMEKMPWNHFVAIDIGTDSLQIRITDHRGNVVKDTIPGISPGTTSAAYLVPGNVQFPD